MIKINYKKQNFMPTQLQQNILQELGIDQMPPERQEEMLTAMTEILLKRLTLRVLGELSEEKRQEFETVCSAREEEKVTKFFSDNVPGYEGIIQEEIAKFKQDMKSTVDTLLTA